LILVNAVRVGSSDRGPARSASGRGIIVRMSTGSFRGDDVAAMTW
jgi:hypothetical protein